MKHIAVLMGGLSAEREVSLSSGAAVVKALETLGHKVTQVDVGRDIAQILANLKPDLVFNALHGRYGEDGCVQGVLEMLGIPYTHSGVLASALAMDKPMAKKLFESAGIRCAKGIELDEKDILSQSVINFPLVVKPANEGSSVGVKIAFSTADFVGWKADCPRLLVEEYIPGREVSVAVLNGKALGVVEMCPEAGFYDYEAKYTVGKATHIMPAPLPAHEYAEVMELAERAHKALGCSGLTRADFRYDDTSLGEGLFYILEVNTQPGMTPLSLAPEIAAYVGIDFVSLIEKLVANC